MNSPFLQHRNRTRSVVRHRFTSPPCLEALEDRPLLSGMPVEFSSLQNFLVEDASQFGPGGALVYEKDGFLGVEFDTGNRVVGGHQDVTIDLPWPFRDLDLGTYGAEATVGLRGTLGFDYGLSINTGSVDADYSLEVSHRFDDPSAAGDVLVDTEVAVLGGSLATHWPEVQTYLNLVLDVDATATLKAWFVGSLGTVGDSDFEIIDLNQELFFLDTAGQGSDVRVLGQTVSGEIVDVSIPIPVPLPPPLEMSLDANLNLESDPLRLTGTNAISVGVPGAHVSTPLGEATLTLSPSINLNATTPESDGRLVAVSALDDYSRLASLSWELGKFLPRFGPHDYSLADVVTLKVNPVSFLAGPRIYAGQSAEVTPSALLTYKFDRPVPVQTGSDAAPFVTVSEVTFAPHDYVNIHFDGEPIVVSPQVRFGMDMHNRFTLDGTLGGELKVGEIALEVDFGSNTTAEWAEDLLDQYLDFHRDGGAVVVSAGPLFAKDFDLDPLLSLPVFDDTFNILSEVRTLPSFTIGPPAIENVTPVLGPKNRLSGVSLTFTEPYDLDTAANMANYRVVLAGKDNRLGTADDTPVALKYAEYDPARLWVEIEFATPMKSKTAMQITVDGTPGITDESGLSLDGDRDSVAGGDYVALIGPKFSYVDHDGDVVSLDLKNGGLMWLTRQPNGDGGDLAVGLAGTVTTKTTLSGSVKPPKSGGTDRLADLASIQGLDVGLNKLPVYTPARPGFRIGATSSMLVDELLAAGSLSRWDWLQALNPDVP